MRALPTTTTGLVLGNEDLLDPPPELRAIHDDEGLMAFQNAVSARDAHGNVYTVDRADVGGQLVEWRPATVKSAAEVPWKLVGVGGDVVLGGVVALSEAVSIKDIGRCQICVTGIQMTVGMRELLCSFIQALAFVESGRMVPLGHHVTSSARASIDTLVCHGVLARDENPNTGLVRSYRIVRRG